jgi:hypothetical protein
LEACQVFIFNFNDAISRGALKHLQELKDFGNGFSNQRDLTVFSSPQKVNLKIGLIPEDDLPKNGQIPADDILRLAKSWLRTSRNLKRRFDETSSLKPSSRDKRCLLVVSQN